MPMFSRGKEPEIKEIQHKAAICVDKEQENYVQVDGSILIQYGGRYKRLIHFRAGDKGGHTVVNGETIWKWTNPEMEISKMSLEPDIVLRAGTGSESRVLYRGRVRQGQFEVE